METDAENLREAPLAKLSGGFSVNLRSIAILIGLMAAGVALAACGSATPDQPLPPRAAEPAAPAEPLESAVAATPAPPLSPAPALPAAPAAAPVPAIPSLPQVSGPPPAPEPVVRSRPAAPATPTPIPAVFPFVVVDSNGIEVVFESPPERIVAFDSAVVEILFAIGEGQRVVATHDFVSYPPETADIPRVGGAFNMDIEATVALEPDLVFIFFDRFQEDLERAGLRVLYLATLSDDFLQVADRIMLWGGIVGNPSAAQQVADDFVVRVDAIKAMIAPYAEGPSVFQDEGDLWTPGQGTLIQQVFDLLKLENIAADISGYVQLSPEVIVQRDPSIIIASYGDNISGTPAFADVLAVKNGAIYVPSSDALSIAGPRFVAGIEELAAWVYPGLFR